MTTVNKNNSNWRKRGEYISGGKWGMRLEMIKVQGEQDKTVNKYCQRDNVIFPWQNYEHKK